VTPAAEGSLRCGALETLCWSLGLSAAPAAAEVAGSLSLRGTPSLRLQPPGRGGRTSIAAPWPNPSFIGAELPGRVTQDEAGFHAEWEDAPLPASTGTTTAGCLTGTLQQASGVALLEAVPTYRMANRATKNALMLVALGFIT